MVLLVFSIAALGEVRISYRSGGSGCQVVRFPRWNLPKNADEHFHFCCHFDGDSLYTFRRVDDTPKDRLLVNVEETWIYKGNVLRSPNKYWMDLSGRPRVRRATDSDWESAGPVIGIFTSPSHMLPGQFPYFEYGGRKYPKSGKNWGAGENVMMSSRSTWLKLASVTPLRLSSDGVALSARVYLDVFHIESGKKVLGLTGSLADFDIQTSDASTGYFLEDRFFVAPIGDSRKTMLICDLSRLLPKHDQ